MIWEAQAFSLPVLCSLLIFLVFLRRNRYGSLKQVLNWQLGEGEVGVCIKEAGINNKTKT